MKTYSGNRILVACGLVIGLAACGDSGNGKVSTDSSTTGDTTTTSDSTDATSTSDSTDATTTTTTTDATSNDTTDTVAPTCTNTGFTVVKQSLQYDAENDYTGYSGDSATTEPLDSISIEFYPSVTSSDPSPLGGPGTYEIGATEDDQNYATCQTCVRVFQNCTADGCEKVFFATKGTIEVETLDQEGLTISGTLKDATLVEVTIDSDTYESTPVAGGDTWCIGNFAFDSTPECTQNSDCTDSTKPICDPDALTCVQCSSSFDCTEALPTCSVDASGAPKCVAGIDECTGDDAHEENDGPKAATPVTLGTPIDAKTCTGASQEELDWYSFTTTGVQNLSAKITWTDITAKLFVVIVDSDGNVQGDVGDAGDGKDEQVFALAPGGNYYAVVVPNDTSAVGNGDTAVPYTLTVTAVAPECTATQACADNSKICDVEAGKCVACITDFDCKTSANPVCLTTDNVAACGKVDACTGDDAGESADDGPAGAVAVTVPTTTPVAAKICGEGDQPSEREADWYKFTLAAADDVTFTLDWTGAAVDLDIAVYDSTGEVVDSSVTKHPEVLALTALPAGDYFIQIVSYEGAPTAAIDYTLAITTP